MQDRGLTALLAYYRASESAISFSFMPSCPGTHWTVNVFPSFASHNFASSRNLMNVAWPDPFGIFPALFATLKLSRHMQIAGACRAIGDSKAISKPRVMANASASYTSCVVPRALPPLLNQLPTHSITHPAPVPLGLPALSYSWDPSVYKSISNGPAFLIHFLTFSAATFLLPVPSEASR